MTQPINIATEVDSYVAEVWKDVESFLNTTGAAGSTFGKAAVNDPNLIRHVRQGKRRLTFNMAVRLRQYMDERQQHVVPWDKKALDHSGAAATESIMLGEAAE